MTLIAKPIIPDTHWVVVDTTGKVGNITRKQQGSYNVKMHGDEHVFDSKMDVEKQYNIKFATFTRADTTTTAATTTTISDNLPTDGDAYNSMIDIVKKVYVFTRTPDSKCYYARGWFALWDEDMINNHEIVLCPKYIFLQRKNFLGPFATEHQARASVARNTNTTTTTNTTATKAASLVADKYYNE